MMMQNLRNVPRTLLLFLVIFLLEDLVRQSGIHFVIRIQNGNTSLSRHTLGIVHFLCCRIGRLLCIHLGFDL